MLSEEGVEVGAVVDFAAYLLQRVMESAPLFFGYYKKQDWRLGGCFPLRTIEDVEVPCMQL